MTSIELSFAGLPTPRNLGKCIASMIKSQLSSLKAIDSAMGAIVRCLGWKPSPSWLTSNGITTPNSNSSAAAPIVTTNVTITDTPLQYNPGAWIADKDSGDIAKDKQAARQMKCRAMKRLRDNLTPTLGMIGTPQQQTLALHEYLTTEKKEIGNLFGLVEELPARKKHKVSTDITESISEVLKLKTCMGKNTNDSIGFQRTLFLAVVPVAPAEDATEVEKANFQQRLKEIAENLEIKSKTCKDRLAEAAVVRRDLMDPLSDPVKLMRNYTRGSRAKHSHETIDLMIEWVQNKCSKIIASPNAKDTRWVRNRDGVKVQVRKYFYTFSVREIYQEMILPVDQGGFALA